MSNTNNMSIRVDLSKAIPYTFTRGGRTKIGLKVDDKFLWLTQTLSPEKGIHVILVPTTDEEQQTKKPINKGSTQAELEAEGLEGYSLEAALMFSELFAEQNVKEQRDKEHESFPLGDIE